MRASKTTSAVFLLAQVLQTTASPLVVGQNGVFDQEFLDDLPSPSSSILPTSISNTIQGGAIYPVHKTQDVDEESLAYPSWFTSTLMARRLLALSTTGVASTIFPDPLPSNWHEPGAVAGLPMSMIEYIADCDGALASTNSGEGNPIFLALNIGTTYRNAAAGSNVSLSIDWWNHVNETKPI